MTTTNTPSTRLTPFHMIEKVCNFGDMPVSW